MDNKNFKLEVTSMSEEQRQNFIKFAFGDDMDFYEEYVMYLSEDEQVSFFQNNPDFMSEFLIKHDRIYLLKDKSFRSVLREIKEYEERKWIN